MTLALEDRPRRELGVLRTTPVWRPSGDENRHRFERCFRDHYAQLLALSMRRVSGREIAEDVVADTFASSPTRIGRPAAATTSTCAWDGLDTRDAAS